jgi:hypothetical protein
MPDVYINPEDAPKPKSEAQKIKQKTAENLAIPPDNIENLPDHTHNPLSSYCYYPHHVHFLNQDPDETIVLLVRRHFFTNLGWIAMVIFMILAPLILNYFPLLAFLPAKFQMAALLVWYLLTLAIGIQGFFSWFFSINLITNKRVIDVDFENLIYRKITDAEINKIEDATVLTGSVVRTLFDYGDLIIQTAAEIPEVTFEAVPHPDKIDKILSNLRVQTP